MTEISFDALAMNPPAITTRSRMRGLTLVREIAREAMYGLARNRFRAVAS